ncbi:cytochrome P450 [Streptomyces sp. NPDC006967]|uniref:cytochrome P450 n=1 Tax=Streptomyces sp. NPDC006967 TaxID=3156906 RepID=UPI0033C47855
MTQQEAFTVIGRCPYAEDDALLSPDPCASYLALKENSPVHRDEVLGVWFVTGFEEVGALLRHPGLTSEWPAHGRTVLHDDMGDGGDGPSTLRTDETVRRWFMFNDGKRHKDLRNLVAPALTADQLTRLRPFVRAEVDALLAPVRERLEVMSELAVPLSSRVICHLLGLPRAVATELRAWGQEIAALLVADYLPEVRTRGRQALREIEDAVHEALGGGELREGSVLALLREAHERGTICAADVTAVASLLIYAGFETTSTFLGRAVVSVLHANAWQGLRGDAPEVVVEELLRFDTSVRQVARVATRRIDIGGHRIAAGDLVLLMMGAADRDPRRFRDPDHLYLDRETGRHLAFGLGPHYCLGAGLARMEAQVALQGLAASWRSAELAEPPVTSRHHGVPILEEVHLRLTPLTG